MSVEKFDQITSRPFAGNITDAWTRQHKYAVIFQDGTKGIIRSPRSRKALLATGRYQYVRAVEAEPISKQFNDKPV